MNSFSRRETLNKELFSIPLDIHENKNTGEYVVHSSTKSTTSYPTSKLAAKTARLFHSRLPSRKWDAISRGIHLAPPLTFPTSADFLRKRQPWKGYILTILSFRRSVAAVCEAGILRSFLLLSLFFGGAPPLQCSTTARAVGPILRLVPGTTANLITNLTNRISRGNECYLDFVELFDGWAHCRRVESIIELSFSMRFLCEKWLMSVLKEGVDISCERSCCSRVVMRQ